jgi:hypothetical protein
MRRFIAILVSILGFVLSIAFMPGLVSGSPDGQIFATNTPRPTQVSFATNTPSGPTSTPSFTPTATETATETATNTSTPTATFTPTATPSPTATPNGPFVYPEGVNPLTGLPYPNEEAMARRNLIVKISNYPPVVRPQTNVNMADVVYEFEAEGGVTRFAAIFRSNAPDLVGSVRSARLSDLELIVMYNALLAYSGTSAPIQNLILQQEWVFQAFSPLKGDNENAGFFRRPREGLDFEHTLFLNTQTLYELATRRNVNTGYQARGFAFSETPDAGGATANDVYVEWYGQADARWQYNPETERYVRFSDGVPHNDAATNEQLWTDNLIIIEVPHNERPDLFPEGATYESLEIALWDQGRAYVVREGKLYQGYWRRRDKNPGSALQVIYGNNIPIMLKPGRTWVTVVRGLGNVTISENLADMPATATAIALSATPIVVPTESSSSG